MATIYLLVLIALVAVPLGMTLRKPALIFEYPFFMAFAFAAFIVPQAYSLIRFPGAVEDASVDAVLLMSCLCMTACLLGYQLAPSAAMLRGANRPVDMQRLFRAGLIFIAVAYVMSSTLSTTEEQFSEAGGRTGTGTILMFFQMLSYPGFAICFFCALRKPAFATIAASAVGVYLPLKDAIIGRRENTAILVLSIVMALFYERGKRPPRLAIAGALVFSMLAIPGTTEYREYANNGNWEGVRQMNLVGIVNLGREKSFWCEGIRCREVASGRSHCLPEGEGSRTQKSMIPRFQQVASESEKILDDALKGEEPLGLTGRFESAHLPFPLAGRLMRDFGEIVGITFCVVRNFAQDRSQGGRVAS